MPLRVNIQRGKVKSEKSDGTTQPVSTAESYRVENEYAVAPGATADLATLNFHEGAESVNFIAGMSGDNEGAVSLVWWHSSYWFSFRDTTTIPAGGGYVKSSNQIRSKFADIGVSNLGADAENVKLLLEVR